MSNVVEEEEEEEKEQEDNCCCSCFAWMNEWLKVWERQSNVAAAYRDIQNVCTIILYWRMSCMLMEVCGTTTLRGGNISDTF